MTPRTQDLLDSVKNIFPDANQEAMRCLAVLLDNDVVELAGQLAACRSLLDEVLKRAGQERGDIEEARKALIEAQTGTITLEELKAELK
jgi:hypothetical protein